MGRLLTLLNKRTAAGPVPLAMPAANREAIVGTVRLAGWAGNCCRVIRASDNAELDIGWVGRDWDFAAILAHAGASTCYVKTWYDMSGKGRDISQATLARMMSCQPAKGWRGKYGATAYDAASENYVIPNTVSVSSQIFTVYSVCAPQAGTGHGVWQLSTGAADRLSLLLSTSQYGDSVLDNSTFNDSLRAYHNSQPTVSVVSGSATEVVIHANEEVSRGLPALAASTTTGGFWGKTDTNYMLYGEAFLLAIYGASHDPATILSVKSQLYNAYDIRTANTKLINVPGDSVGWGQTNPSVPYAYPWTRYLEDSLSERVDIRNTAVPGKTLATIASEFLRNDAGSFRRDYSANVQVNWFGSNDLFLGGGTTGLALYNAMAAYVAQQKALGQYVIVADVIARDDVSSAKQAERVDYNNRLAADWAGAHGFVQLSSTFNNFNDTTLFASDKIHLTLLGYQTVAALMKPAIEAGLAYTHPAVPSLGVAVSDIPNHRVFLNTSDNSITNVKTDGGTRVYQMVNSSVAGDATQTTHTRKPQLLRYGVNSKPSLYFAGAQALGFDSGALSLGAGDNTLIVIYKSDNTGDATHALVSGLDGSLAFRYGIRVTATTVEFCNRASSGGIITMSATRDTNVHVAGFTRSGTAITPFLDGVAGTPGSVASNITCNSMALGAGSVTAGSNRLTGHIPIVIACNAALTASQLNALLGGAMVSYYGYNWAGL